MNKPDKNTTLDSIVASVEGKVLTEPKNNHMVIKSAFSADLMSDVLAYMTPEAVLITGLCNAQVVRTASLADVSAIILVLNKTPTAEMMLLAEEEGIPLISSPLDMYQVSGKLYQSGLIPTPSE